MCLDSQIFLLPIWLQIISCIYLTKIEMAAFLNSFHKGEKWTVFFVNWEIWCLSQNTEQISCFFVYSSRKMQDTDIVSSVLDLSFFLKQNMVWIKKTDYLNVGEFRVEPNACTIITFWLHL